MPMVASTEEKTNTIEQQSTKGTPGSRLLFFIRWCIALGLLYLIFRQLALNELVDVLATSNPWWLMPALVAQLVSSLAASLRWCVLMRLLGFGGRLAFYLASYLKAVLFNQGLPSSIGGDAMRMLDIVRLGNNKRSAFSSVLADRVFGVSGLLLLALIGNNLMDHAFPARFVLVVNVICGGALLSIPIVAVIGSLPGIRNSPLKQFAMLEPIWILSNFLRRVCFTPSQLLLQLLLALLTHSFVVLSFAAIGEALAMQLQLAVYFAFVPPLMLFTLIPLSLAGWGVRETGAVALLALVGVPQEQSFAMSIIGGLVLIATAIPGLVVYLSGHR